MSPDLPIVRLKPGHAKRLRAGHPWVYANEIEMSQSARTLPPGGLVMLLAGATPVGVASFNLHSLIAARLLSRDINVRIDAAFVAARLQRALDLRERLYAEPFYRLAHAEADGLPGVVADRFEDVLVLQLNTAGAEELSETILDAADRVLAPRAIVLRNDAPSRALEGLTTHVRVAKGDVAGPITLREHGVEFVADPLAGQKTGWFYDQRDNRRFVAGLARGLRVLDLYCYTGGFAIAAAAGGADDVTAVDSAQAGLDLGVTAAAANSVGDRITLQRGDCFAVAEELAAAGERFGVVVADPPAFVKSKKQLAAGARGYRKLSRLAARLVAPQGFLFLASCSHNVDAHQFTQIVRGGVAAAGRTGRVLRSAGAGPDHPVHPMLPESAYLTTQVLQLD